ncbi:MAG: hypothetical protein LBD25_06365 [Coriobacteriales bacterium]|jgi:hypothetical protein|nr:hypothetical protein [Coriobacteriales bacterium]
MNMKRSMAVLLSTLVVALVALPVVALVAEVESIGRYRGLTPNPFIPLALIVGALTVAASIVAIVTIVRYRQQQKLVCRNYRCARNPVAKQWVDDGYDFRLIPTPKEFEDSLKVQTRLAESAPLPHQAALATRVTGAPGRTDMDLTMGMIEEVLANLQSTREGTAKETRPVATAERVSALRATANKAPKTPKAPKTEKAVYQGAHVRRGNGGRPVEAPVLQAVAPMKHARTAKQQQNRKIS